MKTLLCLILLAVTINAQSNNSSAEDSVVANKLTEHSTVIGGYGSAFIRKDFNLKVSIGSLERVVLFVGHNFGGNISLFTEMELEDAKLSGDGGGGEIAFEQAYLKFDLNSNTYITAGLFLLRIGYLNENHLPVLFNGTERSKVETLLLPSTWRELGIGLFGQLGDSPFNYSLAIVNGLNSPGFAHGNFIREGRFEGKEASFNNLAMNGAIQYFGNNFRAQVSGYFGGSVGLSPHEADSLQLQSGLFGTPVIIGEADLQYSIRGIGIKLLGVYASIPDAFDLNRAFASNTPSSAFGAYAELSYNILNSFTSRQKLSAFIRYEKLNLNSTIPSNGIIDETLNQDHIIAGLTFIPYGDIVIKTDVRFQSTGSVNPLLIINPNPFIPAYEKTNTFFNIGIGYSF